MTKKSEAKEADEKLIVGIDLGTSRSAISASNGKSMWVDSYVGWPKDFIARKVVGNSVLFGKDALEHRLSLDLYRPLKNGVIKEGTTRDEEAVKELIHHLITLVKPKKDNSKVRAVVGVPAESFKVNKVAIRKAVSDFAESLLVVSEPFAIAYGVNALDNAMVIDIGAGTIDFCIMHGTVPTDEDQRTVLQAGDYIDQQLYNFMAERYPHSDFNLNMVRRFKEEFSFIGDPERAVKVNIPVDGRPTKHDVTEEMRRACESILPAIVETTLELIAKFDPEYQDVIRQNIILAGGGSQIRGIDKYLENVLSEYGKAKVEVVEDPLFCGANGALSLAMDMPEDYWTEV
ncbi:MAG: MamK family actin-like protein [Desulfobulbaceae bacterium]|jgi:rod shape-determining protein MreB|nr:MamK family actin-like protein [Desulfobulbaceae bacterium]MDY0349791.1 MamK family actin-like protein [Desulfobulbaceae bacterium]